MNFKLTFHYISYLQYPLMVVGMYFALQPYLLIFGITEGTVSADAIFKSINNLLILMGLAISFSTLQDTTKTQNSLSLKVWQSPTKGKAFLLFLAIFTFLTIVFGVLAYFGSHESKAKEVSVGLIVLGIGLIGLLKTASEMFDNHRLDKNQPNQ